MTHPFLPLCVLGASVVRFFDFFRPVLKNGDPGARTPDPRPLYGKASFFDHPTIYQ